MRLKMSEICCNSFNMIGRAFCGHGVIHLNIAEIHEDDIGGQKSVLRLPIRLQNERVRVLGELTRQNFLKNDELESSGRIASC